MLALNSRGSRDNSHYQDNRTLLGLVAELARHPNVHDFDCRFAF